MYKFDLGIVIVNYNVRHFLVQCLQSIRNSKLDSLKIEVWVVDNASIDGSIGLLKKDFPEINLIENTQNNGFAKANNQAIIKLNSKYTLLLNPDTVLDELTLIHCKKFMDENKEAGAIGVKMIDGNGKFLPESKRKIPDLWNSFCKLSYLSELFPKSKIFSGYNLGYLSEDEIHEIDVLCGAFMFIRSSTLDKIGLLDEAFFMYGEDIDLSYRIILSGHKIYYLPDCGIIHYKGESTKKSSINYLTLFYGAMLIYVRKHYGKGKENLFSILISVAIFIRGFLSFLGRVIKNWILPIIDGLLILTLLKLVSEKWAEYYFENSKYYEGTVIDKVLLVYTLIWILILKLMGHYENDNKNFKSTTSIGIGTFIILIVYALLPEELRTSRVLILFGTIISISVVWLTSVFISKIFGIEISGKDKNKPFNIAVVGHKESSNKIINTLNAVGVKFENVYVISPDNDNNDPFFTNNIASLPQVVKDLKIHEVIYSNESLTVKEIMHSMTMMDGNCSFKIGGDDSFSIIGSHSRNHSGEYYSVDISYNLASSGYLRFKRIFDILASIVIFILSPLLYFLNGMRPEIYSNIWKVIKGEKTWVGYGGSEEDYNFLPKISAAVIEYPMTYIRIKYYDGYIMNKNIQYAREFTYTTDLNILIENVFKISNK